MQSTRHGKGFTLVELVVVLAIIGLLAGVAVPTILNYRSRRARDVGDAALVLRATLRIARTYAIQNRVRAGVFFSDVNPQYQFRRYHLEYEDKVAGEWVRPLGDLAKDTVLPENAGLVLDETVIVVDGVPAHYFDPTGTLDNASALKANIKVRDNNGLVDDATVEILRATGRVRIR